MKRTLLFTCIGVAGLAGLTAVATAGPTPAQKCQAAKLKEVGKYDSCRLKAEAKAVIKGGSPDMTKCDGKLTIGWAKAELKGEGQCPTVGDEASIGADVVTHTDAIALALSGVVCGNGTVEGPEQCDTANFAGQTCTDFGYDSGALVCTGSCTIDSMGCFDSCDPVAQACGGGLGCYFIGNGAVCAGAGSSTVGSGCMFANSCLPGLACYDPGAGNECVEICSLMSPVCSVGTCTSIGFAPYPDTGLCL